MRQATITINGRLYNALTGEPIGQEPGQTAPKAAAPAKMKTFSDIGPRRPDIQRAAVAKAPARAHPAHPAAHAVHRKPQRAQTLNRQAIQKPAAPAAEATTSEQSITRSPLITRFKPAVIQPAPQVASKPSDAPLEPPSVTPPNTTPLHPSVLKAMQHKASQAPAKHTSKQLKEMLIKERLAEVGEEPKVARKGLFTRQPKLASILVSSLSLLILGGYFTYINLTNISMRVAASRAGISASMPQYRPDGYSLNGPITYAPGEVAINYKSNTNEAAFTLTQKSSNWDSQGVLDNYVRKQTSTYLTFQQRGITVYTFNNQAVWTNGGLLYSVDGDASLSSDQVLRLATSL